MHLLIDTRLTSASDIPFLHYALLWADVWKIYHPHDDISFLAHEDDPHISYDCIRVRKTWHNFSKKKIASHNHGPERVISFSRLPPYDRSIKQVSHISDIAPILYPSKPLKGIEYRWRLHEYKNLLSHSHSIIIPHRDTLSTLSELFSPEEEKITVIPYLHPLDDEVYKIRTILPHGIFGDYFITEGAEGLEWRPLELIEAYATYVHRMGGKEKLIILGDVGDNLGVMSSMIRTLDLLDSIKIIGTLSREERELLYVHAIGWIYAGSYYSRGASIGLASGYNIPLFFTDISGLRNYTGIYFHPNHLERLPELLRKEKNKYQIQVKANNEAIMEVYSRIISE
ncbi:MAG: hypothetical protein HHAS10_09860 [Candidatus Altimarinota bacterium]